MIPKTCPVCSKGISSNRTYCSIQCKSESQKKRVELICVGCGALFKIWPYLQRKTNYCSVGCYHRSTNKKVTKKCPICGNTFEALACMIKKGYAIHCSQKCFDKSLDCKRKTQKCNYCGRIFRRAISLSIKYRKAFCSKKCHDDSMRDYVSISCVNCHKLIGIPQSIINRGKGRFCSWYCYTHFKGETSIEKIVKSTLRKAKIHFQQEVKIGKYHADFLIENTNTLIECDGDYWYSLPSAIVKDKNRDQILQRKGFQIIRFTESEIKKTKGTCVIRHLREKHGLLC